MAPQAVRRDRRGEEEGYGEDDDLDAAEAPKAEETVTHVTKKGKTLTGTIRRDLDAAGAKALDPYAFKKDGGYFIRSSAARSLKPLPSRSRVGHRKSSSNASGRVMD